MTHNDCSPEPKRKETAMKDSLSFLQHLSEDLRRHLKSLLFFEDDTDKSDPKIRVVMRPNELIFRANLPGLQKEDLKVQIDERLLIIQGRPPEEGEDQSEESCGKGFCRCLELPEGVSSYDAHATFRKGVLEVTMPLG